MSSAPREARGIKTAAAPNRTRRGRKGGLSEALRQHTRSLHVKAERSGVVREVLNGRASLYAYALLLRNLIPAYRQIEQHLERHGHRPGLSAIALPALYRSRALESDIRAIWGSAWSQSLPLLEAAEHYARRIDTAARHGARLIGHAYVRYLGDLSGGQVMRRILVMSLGLEPAALSFYDFPDIPDLEGFKAKYRDAIDTAALETGDSESILDEAAVAFQLNIDVSEGVQAAAERASSARPLP